MMNGDYFSEISREDRDKLVREFSSCKIVVALKDTKPYKL